MKSNETSHRALLTVLALPILIPNTAVIVERAGTGGEVVVPIPAVTVVILTTTVVAPIHVVAALGPDPKAARTHPTVARRTRCST